jgi:hypothetical protein
MATFEVLTLDSYPVRTKKVIGRLGKLVGGVSTSNPLCESDWLILWGWGGREQQRAIAKQRQRGGNVLSLDIGYFQRNGGSVRMSINGNHPQHLLKWAHCNSRWQRLGIQLEELADEKGHIVLAGLGSKSRTLYNYSGTEWERGALRGIVEAFPDSSVVYRPKPNNKEHLEGARTVSGCDIRDVLRGARLCVVHHSNVSVDCAVYGIPCVASDGAGAFLYPSEIGSERCYPDRVSRLDLLERVAWFNWMPGEEEAMINFCRYLSDVNGYAW